MRRASVNVTLLALVFLGAILAPIYAGCGSNQRQTTLRASFVTVGAVLAGFETWESEHQDQIIANAPTKEEGRTQLDVFRIKRDKVYAMFPVVYRAIALAAISEDEKSLTDAAAEAQKLVEAVRALKEKP